MNPNPINLKSLRTRFALRFIRALKKIQQQEKNNNTINNGGSNFMVAHHKFNKVKVAADASMAAAVGPRRAWSRAVLSRIRLSWRHRGLARREIVATRRKRRHRDTKESQSQTQELRRLVPGGEVMDLQGLLDETAHYIKCLTTQVKVMRSIVNYCSTT